MAMSVTAHRAPRACPHLPAYRRRWITTVLTLPCILTAALLPSTAAHADPDPSAPPHSSSHTCIRRDITVTVIKDTDATRHRVTGWHCRPAGPHRAPRVLLTGLTYSPLALSDIGAQTRAVDAALSAGTAVYLIRGIGVGIDGTNPEPADQVVVSAQAPISTGRTAPDALSKGSQLRDPGALLSARGHLGCHATVLCAIGMDVCERDRPHAGTDTPLYATATAPAGYQVTPLRGAEPDLHGPQQRTNGALSPLDQPSVPAPSSHLFTCQSMGDHQ